MYMINKWAEQITQFTGLKVCLKLHILLVARSIMPIDTLSVKHIV